MIEQGTQTPPGITPENPPPTPPPAIFIQPIGPVCHGALAKLPSIPPPCVPFWDMSIFSHKSAVRFFTYGLRHCTYPWSTLDGLLKRNISIETWQILLQPCIKQGLSRATAVVDMCTADQRARLRRYARICTRGGAVECVLG